MAQFPKINFTSFGKSIVNTKDKLTPNYISSRFKGNKDNKKTVSPESSERFMSKSNERFISKSQMRFAKMFAVTFLAIVTFVVSQRSAVTVFNAYAANDAVKRKLPIYSVETDKKMVAISFDAAWGADDTDEILRILEDNNVKTTFFMCGYWVNKYPDEVKKIYELGHDIGNHGDHHSHGAALSQEQNKNEIQGMHDKIKELLGIDINLFRPPYGEYNNDVISAAEELGYYTIQWDVDSHDWMEKGVEYEINRVLNNKNLRNGSIILFHNDTKYTPKCLDAIIKGLKEKGYEIVPISELILKDNYTIDLTGRQKANK